MNKNIILYITLETYKNKIINKILHIKKFFYEKILNNQHSNLYNFSTNLLLNEIKNNIRNIIEEYYFIEIVEFELLKAKNN